MNKTLLYFKLPLLVIIVFHTNVNAQFSPLFNKFYPEQVRGISNQAEDVIFLKMASSYPWFGDTLTNNDVLGSFTKLIKYNSEGIFQSILNFPCNDTLYHYGTYIVNQNNKIIVAGDAYYIRPNDSSYDPFIAIINENFEIDTIFYFPLFIENIGTDNLIEAENGIFGHISRGRLRIYNQSLTELLAYNLSGNSSCSFQSGFSQSFFNFNNSFYGLNYNQFNNNDNFYGLSLLKFDNSQSQCEVVFSEEEEGTLSLNFNSSPPSFAKVGKTLNQNSLLINGSSSNSIFILKVDESDKVEVFYKDTIDYNVVNFSFSTIDFNTDSHIYFAYFVKNFDLNEEGILLYCINQSGNLKWKNFYPINEGLEFMNFMPLNHIKATSDKGCLISIGVKGFQDASDVYILRVDSNGNAKDFITSILQVENQTLFSVYPNPTEEVLNLNSHYKNEATLSIFNSFGQILQNNKLANNQNQIDVSHFSKGIYFYQINSLSNDILKSGKFMKQ